MIARMILLAAAAFTALSGSALAADYDIPWFEAHPTERSDFLRRCHNDFRLAQTPECANAEAASIGAWGAQHHTLPDTMLPEFEYARRNWFKQAPPPAPPPQAGKGGGRAA